MEDHPGGDYYSKTPFLKRLPTAGTLALGLALGFVLGHHHWAGLLITVGTWIVCILILHLVFRQPLERLLKYREYDDN